MSDHLFKHEYYTGEHLQDFKKQELIDEFLLLQESYKELERVIYDLERNRRKWAGSTSFLR